MALKLAKLPDRNPTKRTIVLMPELERKLRDYADIYQHSYGEAETIETLIPFMLDAFLDNDRTFANERKQRSSGNSSAKKRTFNNSESSPTPKKEG